MAVESRVWSSLVMAVLLGSVVIGSVIQSGDTKRDQNPFIPDVTGIIVSFSCVIDWFALRSVDHMFKESLQTGIKSMFQSNGILIEDEFKLGVCKSPIPTDYQAMVERCLNTPGLRCAIKHASRKCTVINGGLSVSQINEDVISDLQSLADKAKQIIQSPIVTFGECNVGIPGWHQYSFLMGESMMMSISNDCRCQFWNIDYLRKERILVYELGTLERGSLLLGTAFSKNGCLKIIEKSTGVINIVDCESAKKQTIQFDPKEDPECSISPDGRTMIQIGEYSVRILDLQKTINDNSIESGSTINTSWDQIRRKYLRWDCGIGLRNKYEKRTPVWFSEDGRYALSSIETPFPKVYLLNIRTGEISLLRYCGIRDHPWISEDIFQIEQYGFSELRSVKYPQLHLPLDSSLIQQITHVDSMSYFTEHKD